MKAGETKISGVENRVHQKVEDFTALVAVPSSRVAPGMIIAIEDARATGVYDGESIATVATGRVYVPNDIASSAAYISDPTTAPGRWHIGQSDALAGAIPQLRTVTVPRASLTSAVNGAAQSINLDAVLPANARIVGADARAYTPFTGGGATAVTLDIGTTGDLDAIVAAANVLAAAVDGGPSTMPRGIRPNKTFVTAGAQLLATFTPDGGHNLAGLTAGSITIDVWFLVLP